MLLEDIAGKIVSFRINYNLEIQVYFKTQLPQSKVKTYISEASLISPAFIDTIWINFHQLYLSDIYSRKGPTISFNNNSIST